jgi:hypothetical protein
VTAPPDTTLSAIPLEHAGLCVSCDVVFDVRVLTDSRLRSCRDHVWIRLSRWIPRLDEERQAASDNAFGDKA